MKKIKEFLKVHPIILNLTAAFYSIVMFSRKKRKGKRNSVKTKGVFSKRCLIHIQGNDNVLEIEPLTRLDKCRIFVKGSHNHIHIGKECTFNELEIWIEDDGNVVEMGNNTWVTGKSHFAVTEGTKLKIGDRCLFSEEIMIRTGDSHSVLDDLGGRINNAKSVEIGNHVWIGYRVSILKGTYIGENSVVGTGAVVTGNFGEKIVLAGVPARTIKANITWDSERI